MPAALAAADIGVAPFDLGAHAPLSLGFYWSPLKIFEYMAAGLPVVAPAVDRIPSLVATAAKGCSTIRAGTGARGRSPTRWSKLTDPTLRARLGAAARARAVRDYSWAAHCRALEDAICARRGARRPPDEDPHPDRRVSSGLRRQRLEHLRAGARLARARARRHDRPAAARATASGVRETEYDGFRVRQFGAPAPDIPVRAQLLQEREADAIAPRAT